MDTMCNKSTCPSSILRDLLPVLCPGDDQLETRLRMPEVASTTERRGSDGGWFPPYVWASLQLKFSGVIRMLDSRVSRLGHMRLRKMLRLRWKGFESRIIIIVWNEAMAGAAAVDFASAAWCRRGWDMTERLSAN